MESTPRDAHAGEMDAPDAAVERPNGHSLAPASDAVRARRKGAQHSDSSPSPAVTRGDGSRKKKKKKKKKKSPSRRSPARYASQTVRAPRSRHAYGGGSRFGGFGSIYRKASTDSIGLAHSKIDAKKGVSIKGRHAPKHKPDQRNFGGLMSWSGALTMGRLSSSSAARASDASWHSERESVGAHSVGSGMGRAVRFGIGGIYRSKYNDKIGLRHGDLDQGGMWFGNCGCCGFVVDRCECAPEDRQWKWRPYPPGHPRHNRKEWTQWCRAEQDAARLEKKRKQEAKRARARAAAKRAAAEEKRRRDEEERLRREEEERLLREKEERARQEREEQERILREKEEEERRRREAEEAKRRREAEAERQRLLREAEQQRRRKQEEEEEKQRAEEAERLRQEREVQAQREAAAETARVLAETKRRMARSRKAVTTTKKDVKRSKNSVTVTITKTTIDPVRESKEVVVVTTVTVTDPKSGSKTTTTTTTTTITHGYTAPLDTASPQSTQGTRQRGKTYSSTPNPLSSKPSVARRRSSGNDPIYKGFNAKMKKKAPVGRPKVKETKKKVDKRTMLGHKPWSPKSGGKFGTASRFSNAGWFS